MTRGVHLDSETAATRECGDCRVRFERTDLLAHPDGMLVCPECGNVIESYGARFDGEHVLVLTTGGSNHSTFHLPSEDAANVPQCPRSQRCHDGTYRPVSRDRLAANMTLCKLCDPEHTVDHGTPGTQLARRLEKDTNPDDLRADGGEQR